MKILQLQYFVKTVKLNSITKAAEELYVSQPAISSAIKELEKEFNTTLFIRYNNQLTLTDEGHYLYEIAVELLDNYNKAVEKMNSYLVNSQVLKIAIPPMLGTFLFPPIVKQYTSMYPNVEIQLVELGSVANQKAIAENEVSLGLTVIKNIPEDNKINYVKVIDTSLLFAINKNHPLAKKKSISIKEIGNTPLVLMKEDCLQSSIVLNEFEKNEIKPNIKIRTNQLYTIKELLTNNNLGAFMFNQVLKESDSLVGIPLQEPIELKICLIWNKNTTLNETAKNFIDFIIKSYKN